MQSTGRRKTKENKEKNTAKEPPSSSWWREMAKEKREKFIQKKENKADPKAEDTERAKE